MTRAGSSDEVPDRDLLARHVAGDPDAFGKLVRRHRDRLWAVALGTVRGPEEAADALQDALVSAFRRADSFRGDAAVTTWLHRIVVNACLDRARRRAVRRAEPLPDNDDQVPPTAGDSVESVAEDGARRDAVLAALRRLPAEQRAALVLVDMEGYSVEEAARILDCAQGTVKSRCSRGRARLLPMLGAWAPRGFPSEQDPRTQGIVAEPLPADGVGTRHVAGGAGAATGAVTEPLPAGARPTRRTERPPTDDDPLPPRR